MTENDSQDSSISIEGNHRLQICRNTYTVDFKTFGSYNIKKQSNKRMQPREIEDFQWSPMSLFDLYGSEKQQQSPQIAYQARSLFGDNDVPQPRTGQRAEGQQAEEKGYNGLLDPNFPQIKGGASEAIGTLRSTLASSQDNRSKVSHPETRCRRGDVRIRKPKKQKKMSVSKFLKGYPTKNFLPHFKGTHLNFLANYYGEQYLYSLPFMMDIRDKSGINLGDYERIYRCQALQDGLEAMFCSKVLYRELMVSRCFHDSRRIHQKKLKLFEEAYSTKVFSKIN